MDTLETQIADWRAYVGRARAVNSADVDELEAHLRDQIGDLGEAGLARDEAFLVAVKRMGDVDSLSREFAREHSDRLWKQLVLAGSGAPARGSSGLAVALAFAVGTAVAVQIARLMVGWPGEGESWLARNASLLVLPFLAGYFVRRRRLPLRASLWTVAAFAVAAAVVNLPPVGTDASFDVLVALHVPVVTWFAVAAPFMGSSWRSHRGRMDFVRFTGEWLVYYALLALGGGVLVGLTALVLEPAGEEVIERVVEWVLPAGAAGAVLIAAWLVEAKQSVIENMAPVLTAVFTPLFAAMLAASAVTYAVAGLGGEFDRDLLGAFDALLIAVLGLVLYALSAREPTQPPGWMDRIQLVAVAGALALDVMVLGSMLARIGEFGFTANRVAALGLNVLLLVNLAGAGWLSLRFVAGRVGFHRLERWQTTYLPAFGVWAAVVVAILPTLFRS